MGKIRVLVVDDSVVIRKVVRETLAEDAGIEDAGISANGLIALATEELLNFAALPS